MKISEFAGYGDKMEQLMRSVQAGRIVHALLFVGPHGSGKRTMARLFAQAMVCTGADKPCGVCPACRRFLTGNHSDIKKLELLKDRKTIGVEQVRDLIEQLSLTPGDAGRHIVIVERAELLTPAAQNALLKTLEEPTGDTVIMLVTDSPSAMLTTIRSRCQEVRFSDLSVEGCAEVLKNRGIAPGRAAELAGLSQGSVGRALEIDGDERYFELRGKVLQSLEALKGLGSVPAAAAALEGEKGAESAILDIMELWARDLMAVQSGASPYQSEDLTRLQRASLDGSALLKGVVLARMMLASNVSWSNALLYLYFSLTQPENYGRTKLSWQR